MPNSLGRSRVRLQQQLQESAAAIHESMVREMLCSNHSVDTDEVSLDSLDEEGLFDALEAAQAELLSVLSTDVSFCRVTNTLSHTCPSRRYPLVPDGTGLRAAVHPDHCCAAVSRLACSAAQCTHVARLRRAAVLSQAAFGSAADEASAIFASDSAVSHCHTHAVIAIHCTDCIHPLSQRPERTH